MSNFPISNSAQLNTFAKTLLQKIKFPEKGKSAIKSHNTLLAAIAESIPTTHLNLHSLKALLDEPASNNLDERVVQFNEIIKAEIQNLIAIIKNDDMLDALTHDLMLVGDGGAYDVLDYVQPFKSYKAKPFKFTSEHERNICREQIQNDAWFNLDLALANQCNDASEQLIMIDGLAMKEVFCEIFGSFLSYVADECGSKGIIIPQVGQALINKEAVNELFESELRSFNYVDFY